MSAPLDIRPIVKNLLSGARRVDQTKRLFEWLRFRTGAKAPSVKDIGDFLAHRDERDRGITWELGRDYCLLAAKPAGKLPHTPAAISDALLATFRLIGADGILNMTGTAYNKIQDYLEGALKKIQSFDGKNVSFSTQLDPQEDAAFRFI